MSHAGISGLYRTRRVQTPTFGLRSSYWATGRGKEPGPLGFRSDQGINIIVPVVLVVITIVIGNLIADLMPM